MGWREFVKRAFPSSGHELLDNHEEQHALATGIGLGFAATAAGDEKVLGVAGAIIVQALERGRRPAPSERQDLANDIQREIHYFAAGVALGAVVAVSWKVVVSVVGVMI